MSVLLWQGWGFARSVSLRCAFPSPCHGLSLQPFAMSVLLWQGWDFARSVSLRCAFPFPCRGLSLQPFAMPVLLWQGWDFARLSGCAFPFPCRGLSYMTFAECVRLSLSFYTETSSPRAGLGSALSVPIRKTPDFRQAHSASHVTWLGFCSLRFTSLRIPIPLPRAILHDLRRMCQAAPVFPVPKLPVPEQGSALSVPIRKTPDFCQAHSASHVTWLGFCSLFHFAAHSHSPAAGYLCNLSLCLYFCGRVGILLAFQAAHSHSPATGYLTTLPQYAQQVVLFIFIPSAYKSLLLTLPDKNKAGLCPAYCFCCDPVGSPK